MDEGAPIAYTVLEDDVPVYDLSGAQVATVARVLAVPQVDVFHGLIVDSAVGPRFVPADDVAAIHEHGVDVRLGPGGLAALPTPEHGAPAFHDEEPGATQHAWRTWLDRLTGANPRHSGWRRDG